MDVWMFIGKYYTYSIFFISENIFDFLKRFKHNKMDLYCKPPHNTVENIHTPLLWCVCG